MLAPGVNDDDLYLQGGGGSGNNSGNGGGGGGGNNNDNGNGDNADPTIIVPEDILINYEIATSCNLQNEIGEKIKLNYEIRSNDIIVESGSLLVSDKNTDNKSILESRLTNGTVNIYVEKTLPPNYSISKIYYANKQIADKYPTDYTHWETLFKYVEYVPFSANTNSLDFLGIQASELLGGGLAVAFIVEKVIDSPKPIVSFDSTNYSKQIKDSDLDGIVNIKFNQTDCDFVDFYIASDKKIRVESTKGSIELLFKKDFGGVFGSKKIIVVPYSDLYGTGDKSEILLNFISVNDFPSITEIIYVDNIDVPSFSDLEIEYEVNYTTFSTSFIDVDLLLKDKTKISLFKKLTPNGSFKINLKQLKDKFAGWNGSDNVTIYLKPTNTAGENVLIGNEYEIKTSILYPRLNLNEDIIKKSIYDIFIEKLQFLEPEKESKYLTHLANFGNDEQIIISSWENDNWTLSKKSTDELGNEIVKPEDEVKSVILKLYNPLPANITSNSTFWITKLMSNPLIETIVLNQQDNLKCPPIKGPNFNIDVDFVQGSSTGYESLDNILLNNDVTSSSNLITTYLSSSLSNTDELNIDYASGSTYLWNNFVHFSSAKERVDNFVYKVQLIETYETAVSASNASQAHSGSLASIQEAERQLLKKNQLINNFDGFEKFLYTSSSLSWPYNGNSRIVHTNNTVISWYRDMIELAEDYDVNNADWVQNNIPQFIVNNEENRSLLLFFSMIGQHFDNIYFYTKSIEKSRNLGYKSKDGVSDKLLHDVLKSFDWDAKNLAADSKLWEYTFGLDLNGNQKFDSPAKQRTYEIWRRILNNLPYLLKHKGTRKGVYALLSCYGIPSSNLSIFEFGGPEVSETTKSKLVYDNITTALKMNLTSSIHMGWGSTNNTSSLRPNTIELFVKPSESTNYTLISGSGWNVSLTASIDERYGQVAFNYNTTNVLSSSILPIYNGEFFGISVSSGSAGLKLDVRQANKERTIFQESITASVVSNWNNGNSIRLGGNYSGSVDEFRLWSSQLDTQRFYEHVSFPEMINGNDIYGSTDELHFRLDFEYPKNLNETYGTSSLINVDTNIYYPLIQLNPSSSLQITRNILEETGSIGSNVILSINPSASYLASATGFTSITDYPYNFEVIDRTVVLEIPDLGSGRYSTNKVRFESQYNLDGTEITSTNGVNLSANSRGTKKAFDQSPTDSNRVGLFFSPTKELNIDIAKSFGGINLDNYIGDPGDRTKSNYKSLDNLRNYYFQRFDNRNIYEYINLIKLYEKSMFEDIKKMLPARVKATTGLLIEPHILERSKIAQKDPTGEEYQKETTIHYGDTTILSAENSQYESVIDANLSENLTGENNQYESVIDANLSENLIADSYQYDSLINDNLLPTTMAENYQQNVTIDARLDLPTILTEVDLQIDTFGQTEYETIGFGIYAEDGHAIRTYFDKNGRRVKERIKVNLVKEEKTRKINVWNVITPDRKGDPRGGMRAELETYYETKLYIQPYSGSTTITAGKNNIVQVTAVDGYLPTHYRNTSDLTTGLQNSFFRGSKNTAATTLDGSSPVETFISNPTTLTVNKTGRNTAEPILEVE
jgi:hypothetical protein